MALPEIPDSWNKLLDKFLQIVVLLVASWGAITGHNNANRADQIDNKVEEVKRDAEKAATKADSIEKKADNIGKKVGAVGPG